MICDCHPVCDCGAPMEHLHLSPAHPDTRGWFCPICGAWECDV